MKHQSITLAKFLSRYLGLDGQDLTKITHEDAKIFFPDLKRTTFSYLDAHPEELINGTVALVTDGHKEIPYYIPREKGLDDRLEFKREEEKKQEKKGKQHYDYSKMSVYELKQLLNVRFNSYKCSRRARQELENRGIVLRKKYKRDKKVEME